MQRQAAGWPAPAGSVECLSGDKTSSSDSPTKSRPTSNFYCDTTPLQHDTHPGLDMFSVLLAGFRRAVTDYWERDRIGVWLGLLDLERGMFLLLCH